MTRALHRRAHVAPRAQVASQSSRGVVVAAGGARCSATERRRWRLQLDARERTIDDVFQAECDGVVVWTTSKAVIGVSLSQLVGDGRVWRGGGGGTREEEAEEEEEQGAVGN